MPASGGLTAVTLIILKVSGMRHADVKYGSNSSTALYQAVQLPPANQKPRNQSTIQLQNLQSCQQCLDYHVRHCLLH